MVLQNPAGASPLRGRIKLDAAPFVENDDQNMAPAEKWDERLTAPLLRLLPGGRRGHEARAPGP